MNAVLAFVFVNSLGTGAVTLGVFFLARETFGYGPYELFLLGALIGVAYIPGAAAVGPALDRLRRRYDAVNARRVMGGLMLLLGGVCFLPAAVVGRVGQGAEGTQPGEGGWSLWVFLGCYALLSGALWPIVESYVSGGRRGAALRRAVGRFNVVWASAVVLVMWAMAPLVETDPLRVLTLLGFVHIGAIGLLWRMGAEPGEHVEDAHEPHPPVYHRLLAVFRVELIASYIVISALAPFLAFALPRLGVSGAGATPIASVWMIARLLTFLGMERWGGWHGRWSVFFVSGALMLGGFAACVWASMIGTGEGLTMLVAGLIACGVGLGGIYAAALYYVMEVGGGVGRCGRYARVAHRARVHRGPHVRRRGGHGHRAADRRPDRCPD
ncbi:hypothetical protein JYU07_00255 [Roseiflexus sp. AH-315-K22]|nr:hypothetical protein [Roseiflexus sp. AH-315-K22]